jgi:hypothetical protein
MPWSPPAAPQRAPMRARARTAVLLAAALMAGLVHLPGPAGAQTGATWDVERLSGDDGTIISAVVANRTRVTADTVVLARGDVYPDALAGAPLAGLLDAPILLSDQGDLPPHVYSQIDRLRPTTVVLLGGESALTPGVEATLRDRLGIPEVRRIGGATRFETAGAIAAEVVARGGADRAYLVRGEHPEDVRAWPDAVAVSALAAREGRPILLAGHTALPAATAQALDQLALGDVTIIGGPAAVSHEIGAAVADTGRGVDRIAGDTRFTTSLAVADVALSRGADVADVWLVSGGTFADALVSAAAVGRVGGTMLLTDGRFWAASGARAFLHQRAGDVRRVTVVGSPDDLPPEVDRDLVLSRTGRPAAPAVQGGAVRIEVGQDAQAVVDAHPPGTQFVLASGVHRLQSIVPRTGDRFTGEHGAELNGAIVLDPTAFTRRADGRWVGPAPAADPAPMRADVEMAPGFERQADPNELWADHVRVRHVNAPEQVDRPRTWYFDYAADQIVMFDDPRSVGRLELSVTPTAFDAPIGAGIADVVIENLVIRRYANPPSIGAIHGGDSRGWRLSQVEVVENHAVGVKVGPGMVIERSRFIRNGQLGINGTDVLADGTSGPIRVESSEIAHNGELAFIWQWEAGAIKFGETTGLVLRGSWIHNHRGPGPWFDVGSRDSLIESNLVEHNHANGVMYEISSTAVITDNVVRNNGVLAVGDLGAGLWVSNSDHVLVEHNLIEGNRLPINAQSSPVRDEGAGLRRVEDLLVRANDIRIDYIEPGLRVTSGDEFLYRDGNNRFESNTYRLRDAGSHNFYWGEMLTIDAWRAEYGHDLDGVVRGIDEPGTVPPRAFAIGPMGTG